MSDEIDDKKGQEELDNVLTFTKPVETDADIRARRNMIRAKQEINRCRHRSVWVVEQFRNCECRRCGAIIEAFDWLLERTKEGDKVDWELREIRDEIKRRRENLERLKQTEVNTRGRIRRAEFKLNDLETAVWKKEQEKKKDSE